MIKVKSMILGLAVTSSMVIAQDDYQIKMEINDLHGISESHYPTLNIGLPTKTELELTPPEQLGDSTELDSITFHFENAPSLTASNFKNVNGAYVATIEDAWIYRGVNVTVDQAFNLENNSHITIHASVKDFDSYTGETSTPYFFPPILFDQGGILKDVTPKVKAHEIETTYQGSAMTISLYRRLVMNDGHPSFDLKVNWSGHDIKSVKVPAPTNHESVELDKALELIPMGNNDISIRFKRDGMYSEEYFVSLDQIVQENF